MKAISKTREITVTLLTFNGAEGISLVISLGDKLSFSSLSELEEDYRYIFIIKNS
jgi:hypothetical protein